MSHFYGTLKGNRGEATRTGTSKSGLTVHAASWRGAVCVTLSHDAATDTDHYHVALVPWHGAGARCVLAKGVLGAATCAADL